MLVWIFLGMKKGVEEALRRGGVARVDLVFFFSYVQPMRKGGVTAMWSDANALVDVNVGLLRTFVEGLKLASFTPKRLLLQTGAKHYGFHMGPATNPSCETDPRVTLESNLYYPQDELLYENCKEVGLHGTCRTTFSLQEWSESNEVVKAWDELKTKDGLLFDLLLDRAQVFGLTNSALLGGWPLSLSMRKARKFGFHGTVDSYEAAFSTLQGHVRMRVAVPMSPEVFDEVVQDD